MRRVADSSNASIKANASKRKQMQTQYNIFFILNKIEFKIKAYKINKL
jgi:hypothetical protein